MNLEHEKAQMLKDFHIQKEMVISEHEKEMEIHVKFIYLFIYLFTDSWAEDEPWTWEGSDAEGFPHTEGDGHIRAREGDGNTRQIYLFIYEFIHRR